MLLPFFSLTKISLNSDVFVLAVGPGRQVNPQKQIVDAFCRFFLKYVCPVTEFREAGSLSFGFLSS